MKWIISSLITIAFLTTPSAFSSESASTSELLACYQNLASTLPKNQKETSPSPLLNLPLNKLTAEQANQLHQSLSSTLPRMVRAIHNLQASWNIRERSGVLPIQKALLSEKPPLWPNLLPCQTIQYKKDQQDLKDELVMLLSLKQSLSDTARSTSQHGKYLAEPPSSPSQTGNTGAGVEASPAEKY